MLTPHPRKPRTPRAATLGADLVQQSSDASPVVPSTLPVPGTARRCSCAPTALLLCARPSEQPGTSSQQQHVDIVDAGLRFRPPVSGFGFDVDILSTTGDIVPLGQCPSTSRPGANVPANGPVQANISGLSPVQAIRDTRQAAFDQPAPSSLPVGLRKLVTAPGVRAPQVRRLVAPAVVAAVRGEAAHFFTGIAPDLLCGGPVR